MCILCVIQKCSRRVATMLPWLIIPLIGLWALSQLLPPGFRFEITSPRLACLMVLLVTLFWYEVLMPKLSSWRIRRSAWLRERKRVQAIELQKLRKMAVRRCRNCLTPYRDQNPGGGGKFMCSYCGHISKRPVLDIPGSADLDAKKSGFVGDLVGKGGKIWNGKVWSEHGWICSNDWLENGNWVPGSFMENSSWIKNGGRLYSGKDLCFAEKSYSVIVVFFFKVLFSFFFSVRWLWRKIFRVSSSEDGSSDAEHMGMSKKGENGVNIYESKVEKARRKAEEKRQARLERELLEEEERKQREDVAKLVEERRRLRDEKMEAEKQHARGSANDKEKDSKREAEKKRQERRKDKDKGSNKSNSDCEEIDRRAGKELDRKRELDKTERRDQQKGVAAQISESRHGIKVSTANVNKGSGTRYLERVKGSLISSSRALNGTNFFGKGTHTNQTSATNVSKANKLNGFVDHSQGSANQRDMHNSTHAPVINNSNGDNNVIGASPHRLSGSEMQSQTVKKSWQQLFTRSPGMSNMSPQVEVQRPNFHLQSLQMNPFQNQLGSNLPLPSHVSLSPNGSKSSMSYSSSAAKPIFPVGGEPPYSLAQEESEIFEDPCYVPDPVALLGPVSESLDHFSYDLGTGFMRNSLPQNSMPLKHVITSVEVSKPSPIEPPMSRLHGIEERLTNSFPCSPKTPDRNSSPLNESNSGTWQMWGTSPLGQDSLGFAGGPSSWLPPIGQNSKSMTSKFVVDQVPPGNHFQRGVQPGSSLTGGTFSPISSGLFENDPWLPNPISPPLSSVGERYSIPVSPPPDVSQSELTYGSSSRSATRQPFEPSPVVRWPKKNSAVHGLEDGIADPNMGRPHIGGLFSTPDVQSVWSYN
ncbi:hypothetical protein MKW94_002485 [Papaver nudicaule]|uniref:Stress response NST1-like protein n=1 Tax=Papaver nudicaule TaxID=74823 RepID=A0AA41SER5_PAPNU|nr:hypothetical protein [Papaver nudicaule]